MLVKKYFLSSFKLAIFVIKDQKQKGKKLNCIISLVSHKMLTHFHTSLFFLKLFLEADFFISTMYVKAKIPHLL